MGEGSGEGEYSLLDEEEEEHEERIHTRYTQMMQDPGTRQMMQSRYEEFKRFKRRRWTTTPKERRAWEELADAYLVCKHCNPNARRMEHINKWMRTWKSTNKGENVNDLSKHLYALVSMCGRRGIAETVTKDQSSDLSSRGGGTTKSVDSPLASLFGFCGMLLSCCLVGLCVSRFWSKIVARFSTRLFIWVLWCVAVLLS